MNGTKNVLMRIAADSETEVTGTKTIKQGKSSVIQVIKRQAEETRSFKESTVALKIELKNERCDKK